MSSVSIIAFSCAAGIVLSVFRKRADPLSPGRLFGLLWSVAIGLTDLKFSALQNDWTAEGWSLLLIGLASFFVGVYIIYVLNFYSPMYAVSDMRIICERSIGNENFLYRATLMMFLLYVLSYAGSALIKGFVPMFTTEPSKMRTQFTVFGLGLLVHAAPAIMFFVVQYMVLVRRRVFRKLILVFIFLMTATTYFFLLQRFDYAVWAVTTAVFLYYSSRYMNWKTMLLPLGLFLVLFYAVQSVRLVGHIENYIYYRSEMKFPIEYAVFTEPYMYVVMNLENFVRSSQLLDAHTYGFYSFNSVMSLTGLKHWIEGYWNLDEAPFIIGGYNTYSFLWTYYRDFGIPGLMAFPLIEGSVIAHLYYRMRRNPGVHTVSLYGLAVFTMVISFFFNVLSMLQFIVIVAMVYIVSKAADGRRSRFVIRRG